MCVFGEGEGFVVFDFCSGELRFNMNGMVNKKGEIL